MSVDLWAFLYAGIMSVLLYYFFCRLSSTPCRWYFIIVYVTLSLGIAILRYFNWMGEFLYGFLGILLLTNIGIIFQKIHLVESLTVSSLIVSVSSVMSGMVQSFVFWLVSSVNSMAIFKFFAYFQNFITIALVIFAFSMIMRFFSGGISSVRQSALLILNVPMLFITFIGFFLSEEGYGSAIVFDTAQGLVAPMVNNLQLLILRLLACGGLSATLFMYHRLVQAIEHEQVIQLLEQQTQNQEIYVKEAKGRYEQTRSFRHDIRNHLLVLRQLLVDEKLDAAQEYLRHLDEISDSLSFPIQTGNSTVDALLGSKLAVAAGKGIHIECSVHIPKQSGVNNIDWCIVLSNAIDNAVSASEDLGGQNRMIHISGSQKGNLYLLNIENRCHVDTKPPKPGIGLSNIKAVTNKYNGKMEVEVIDDIFKLSALFVIPQQSGGIPQQTD